MFEDYLEENILIFTLMILELVIFCSIILLKDGRKINNLYYEVWFMNKEKKFNFKDMTKNAVSYSKQKYGEAKEFTNSVAVPKIKQTVLSTKESVSTAVSNVSNKVKTTITEEQM